MDEYTRTYNGFSGIYMAAVIGGDKYQIQAISYTGDVKAVKGEFFFYESKPYGKEGKAAALQALEAVASFTITMLAENEYGNEAAQEIYDCKITEVGDDFFQFTGGKNEDWRPLIKGVRDE